ncbi:ABC transporter permease [Halomonas sp. LBP4]|uniref:ABC transporter permease n=1 Tax=Halomonas sp. LBP4 TaxID=2044917 RepID=UPI000D755AC6|nr:ABC transporter permease [Halomonas sp. LBP4]PXX95282.1 ABC transporter permease [Halomonas sp. LBP4]
MRREVLRPNRVLPLLMLVALAAWLGLEAVSVAPNRIVPGSGFRAHEVVGWTGALAGCLPLLAVAALAWRPTTGRLRLVLALAVLLLMAMPAWLGLAVTRLVDPAQPQARLGLGGAFWVLLFLLLLALIELRARLRLPRLAGWGLLVPVLLAWWLALASWLEPLALLQEYRGRSDQFAAAVGYHLGLVGAAVGASLVIGVALALLMRRHAGLQKAGFGVLNFLQTIPSLALFGLLLAPLAWLAANVGWLAALGVRGIGWAPAFLALVGYSLLPMVRNTFVALEGVDPAVIESARGMGMSPRQVFLQVRLPLALPVMLEGLRITTVQAIGLTAVAALIGAGGLGGFIFQGLGQAAMDLVLLGALPILVMALVADALLGALTERLHPGGTR